MERKLTITFIDAKFEGNEPDLLEEKIVCERGNALSIYDDNGRKYVYYTTIRRLLRNAVCKAYIRKYKKAFDTIALDKQRYYLDDSNIVVENGYKCITVHCTVICSENISKVLDVFQLCNGNDGITRILVSDIHNITPEKRTFYERLFQDMVQTGVLHKNEQDQITPDE